MTFLTQHLGLSIFNSKWG